MAIDSNYNRNMEKKMVAYGVCQTENYGECIENNEHIFENLGIIIIIAF